MAYKHICAVLSVFYIMLSTVFLACEQGHLDGNSCYEFHPDINTYAEARDICYTKRGHLADVANENINLILQNMLELNGVPSAYIGLQVLDGKIN